tara:strand:+ start:6749 stop:7177 length:429 start_codon:yes stop_codon:yes gene_type:complete
MNKVQCTFRLPIEVVELIDSQTGKTRTDKLLSLLGVGEKSASSVVMQSVISPVIEERISVLEERLSLLENSGLPSINKSRRPANSAYEARTNNVIHRCRTAWLSLSEKRRGTITKKEFSELSGVARGTVTKYWDRFTNGDDE